MVLVNGLLLTNPEALGLVGVQIVVVGHGFCLIEDVETG